MEQAEIKALLKRYQDGECTSEEKLQLELWFHQEAAGSSDWALDEQELSIAKLRVWRKLNRQMDGNEMVSRIYPFWKLAMAAAVLVVIGAGLFYYADSTYQGSGFVKNDIKPGSNKACLTLANGQKLYLTDAAQGVIANQAGIQIRKTAGGQIIYTVLDTDDRVNGTNYSNTIETPRGGQYQVSLPDGSRVWLNTASKLIYPVSFKGLKTREISLTGEAYFEIFKDKQHPFRVKTAGQNIEVLGTHFNVNSYADEPIIKTTLLEGSVRLFPTSHFSKQEWQKTGVILKPGQESILENHKIRIREADTEAAVDWKNGEFTFANEPLEVLMRKIARWYDVDIIYEKGKITSQTFSGSVSRYKNVRAVLRIMERTGELHFKINGRQITVISHEK